MEYSGPGIVCLMQAGRRFLFCDSFRGDVHEAVSTPSDQSDDRRTCVEEDKAESVAWRLIDESRDDRNPTPPLKSSL